MISNSSGVNLPGLFKISNGIPILPMSCNEDAKQISSISSSLRSYLSVSFNTFDELESSYDNTYPFSLLHYAFIFRKYDKAYEMLKNLSDEQINQALHVKGPKGYEWITPLVCAKWNLNYICAFDERYNLNLMEYLIPYLDEVLDVSLACEYDNLLDDIDDTLDSVGVND